MSDFEFMIKPRNIFVIKSKNGKYLDFSGGGIWVSYFYCSKFYTESDLLERWKILRASLQIRKNNRQLERLRQSLISAKIIQIEFEPIVSDKPFLFNLDIL